MQKVIGEKFEPDAERLPAGHLKVFRAISNCSFHHIELLRLLGLEAAVGSHDSVKNRRNIFDFFGLGAHAGGVKFLGATSGDRSELPLRTDSFIALDDGFGANGIWN